MTNDWQLYQDEAADFFRSLGLEADTNVTVQGVRTTHDVDVLVTSHHAGFEIRWIVECKYWQNPVSKLHVLALREIVTDAGADRGILLCEKGFQSGALEAAALTNVRLTSLAQLKQTASVDILSMRLRELFDRTEACKQRYWAISKGERIDRGLRPESDGYGYSGQTVFEFAEEVLAKALRGIYPFEYDESRAIVLFRKELKFASPSEVLAVLEPLISELETRLKASTGTSS